MLDVSISNAHSTATETAITSDSDGNTSAQIVVSTPQHEEQPGSESLSPVENPSRNSRERVLKRLSEALLRRSLTKIDLSQRGLRATDARLVRMALAQNAHLSVLKLGYNNLGDQGAITLATGIAVHKALQLVDLGFNNIGDEGAKALAVAMRQSAKSFNGRTIRTLYLAGNLIGEDGALAIADVIRQGCTIRKLYLTGNRIGAEGARGITEAIIEDEIQQHEKPAPESTKNGDSSIARSHGSAFVGMQELFLGGTGLGSVGCQAVAKLLERTSSIRVLSLPNCSIGDEEVSVLAASIRVNRIRLPIESLQLSFNNITHRGLESLSNALWGSSTLKELKVDNNEIGDRGAHQIAAVLPALKALEVLDVGFNGILAPGLGLLMKAVADTDQISSLSLSGNTIDVTSAKAVAYALAYNQSLRTIFLVHCSITHEGQRHISAGAVSNSHTSLRSLTGFALGPVVLTLGFPEALKNWSNEQVMNLVQTMYEKKLEDETKEDVEKELDPLSFLPGEDESSPSDTRPKPLEANVVAEIAQKAYDRLVSNGMEGFMKRRGKGTEPAFGSPIANDPIVIEAPDFKTDDRDTSSNGNSSNNSVQTADLDQMPKNNPRSFIAAPEAELVTSEAPDPARKQRIIEWLCSNIQHMNELAQLSFSSRELWRLHQHYFTPVVNESGGSVANGHGDRIVSSVPEVSRNYGGGSTDTPSTQSSEDPLTVPVSDLSIQGPPCNPQSLPILKRKVSYRFLGDATSPTHIKVEVQTANTVPRNPVSKLIEDGHTGHSLPPKTKRARRNRTRISFVPRIKAKLDSYLDSCHEKALVTMRQLYFVEHAILGGQVNPLAPDSPKSHLCGILASEAEMIIVDMI